MNGKTGLQESQASETGEERKLLLMKEDLVREHLNKPDINKSMLLDRMHLKVPREQANVILRPLLTIFERS